MAFFFVALPSVGKVCPVVCVDFVLGVTSACVLVKGVEVFPPLLMGLAV